MTIKLADEFYILICDYKTGAFIQETMYATKKELLHYMSDYLDEELKVIHVCLAFNRSFDVTEELLAEAYDIWYENADEDASPPKAFEALENLDDLEKIRKSTISDNAFYRAEVSRDYYANCM